MTTRIIGRAWPARHRAVRRVGYGRHAPPRPRGEPLSRPGLPRVLGRADLLLFSVSAILTTDALASAASVGVTWFFWWAVVVVAFFVPYGLVTAELGAAWPQEGGLFVWVREAMGPRWGSLAAWFYWINNAYWLPSAYLVFAGTFHSMFLKSWLPPALADGAGATWLQTAIALVVTWLTVWLGVIRLSVSKWVPSVGALVKTAIFVALGALGLAGLAAGGRPANEFGAGRLLPHDTAGFAFLPVLLYNVLGFEVMSAAGEEMKEPQRDVPRAIAGSGLVLAVVYAFGVLGILLAIPLDQLSLVTGTWDALETMGRRWGSAGGALVLFFGIAFLYSLVANIVTWSLGANRVAAIAAREGALPSVLGRLHPQHGTPTAAFVAMGIVASVLLLGNATVSARADNVFWLLFRLSSICLLASYLLLFPAFVLLRRRQAGRPRPYRVPGGPVVAWTAAGLCWTMIAIACVLYFAPTEGADPAVAARENRILLAETALTLLVGIALMPRRRA